MAKAFSIARALNRDHTKIVEGHLDADDWIGNELIDSDTLCFNTGFVDKNGKEIFERDVVQLGDRFGAVAFDEDEGSFVIKIKFRRRDADTCRIVDNTLKVITLEEKNNE